MDIRKEVSMLSIHCGYVVPNRYGLAYRKPGYLMYVYYLKPLNYVVRLGKKALDYVIWFWMRFWWVFGVEALFGTMDEVDERCRKIRDYTESNRFYRYSLLRWDEFTVAVARLYWQKIKKGLFV